MDYNEITAFVTAQVPLQIKQVTHFCIDHVHLAMIIIGLAVLLLVALISIIKRIFFPDASIIRSAHEKRQSLAKKLVQAKEAERSNDDTKRVRARKVKSGSKKYILVPHDEWQEFIAYKKQRKLTRSSDTNQSMPEGVPVLKLKKGYSSE